MAQRDLAALPRRLLRARRRGLEAAMTYASRIADADRIREDAQPLSGPQAEERDMLRLAEQMSWTKLVMLPKHLDGALDRLVAAGLIELKIIHAGPAMFRLTAQGLLQIAKGERDHVA